MCADPLHPSGASQFIRRQSENTRETSQAVERRPGQILEEHALAKYSTIQANS